MNATRILLILFIALLCLITLSCRSEPETAEEAFSDCQAMLDKDDLEGVGKCTERVMAENPALARSISARATMAVHTKCLDLLNKNEHKKSVVCFEGYTALDSDEPVGYFQLAQSYYNLNKSEGYPDPQLLGRARQAIEKSIKLKPGNAEAHLLNGKILLDMTLRDMSLAEFRKATELSPSTFGFWIESAIAHEKLSDTSGAVVACLKALELKPDDADTLERLANLYAKTFQTDKAIATLEKLLKADPSREGTQQKLDELKATPK